MGLGLFCRRVPDGIFKWLRTQKISAKAPPMSPKIPGQPQPDEPGQPQAGLLLGTPQLGPSCFFSKRLRTSPFSPFAMPAHKSRPSRKSYVLETNGVGVPNVARKIPTRPMQTKTGLDQISQASLESPK